MTVAKIRYRRDFLRQLKSSWAVRFPEWKQGAPRPIFYASPDATFSYSSAFASRGLFFHALIEFSPKIPGSFTCDIIINDGETEVAPGAHRWAQHIPTLSTGNYRIGRFISDQDTWWHLHDEVEEARKFYELIAKSSGTEPFNPFSRREGDWYASNYEAPFAEIVAEAETDFSDTFAKHVLPKLGL